MKTNDLDLVKRFKIATWPRLVVSRNSKISVYEMLSPRTCVKWIRSRTGCRRYGCHLCLELTAANARAIMHGKYVVLAILNRQRADEFVTAKREINNAASEWIDRQQHKFELERQELRDAKQLRIEEAEDKNDRAGLRNAKLIRIVMDEIERQEVAFAWVDGVFWERWIKSTFGISVKDGE